MLLKGVLRLQLIVTVNRIQPESGREQRLKVRLVLVLAKARDLAGRRHLHTKNRICPRQAAETELRNLDANIVLGNAHFGVSLDGESHHGIDRHLDQIDTDDLGDERERARRADITLDNLDLVILGNELDVEWTSDIQGARNLGRSNLDLCYRLGIQVLRWQDQGRVTRMHAGVLDMFGDDVHDHHAIDGHRVHLDLLGLLNVLCDHHRVFARHSRGLVEICPEIIRREHNVHGRTRQDVGRSHQHRILNIIAELGRLVKIRQLLPQGLIDAISVAHARELVTVLCGAHDLDVLTVQGQRDVVGRLSTHRHDDAGGSLNLVYVEHALDVDVLKVQAVGLVVIRTDGFRVVIDHDGLDALPPKGADGANRAPVELDRATDTIHTRAKDHHAPVFERNIMLHSVVGHIKVVGEGRELGSDCDV
ncbi:hypothetical protein BC938DRAFT_480689 [Jimgerdemannia flammicorona]|uniref:Uncharacterized protein n=1 Tax=Jimgerdemannia flammicorona TaxID=994334 RepID=A0A433QHX6_9FUNG|nr:hypothetical protein BC938DRAFT_480689 [Jimgerdemannia flammicorona]